MGKQGVREARATTQLTAGTRRRARLVVAASLVLALAVALAGCAQKKAAPQYSPTDPAGKAACYKVQQDYETAIVQYEMAHAAFRPPLTPAQWERATGIKVPVCPAGGALGWDPTQQQLICSIHGHYNTD
jgi:hypothetical protein